MKIKIQTSKREEVIDITKEVKEVIKKTKIKQCICFLFSKHTTASLIINESADSRVGEDIIDFSKSLIKQGIWKHDKSGMCERANADAHIKSSLFNQYLFIPIENNKLELGTWQAIFLAEFDGPREREIIIKIIKT